MTVVPPAAPPRPVPASVIKAGLEAVYNLRSTAGIRNAPNKVPGRDALPSGVTLQRQGPAQVQVKGPVNFDRWDFSGWSVWVDGEAPVTFTDCLFRPAPRSGQYLVYGGHGSGGKAPMTFTRCTLDGTTELLPSNAPGPHPEQVQITTYGPLTLIDCAMINLTNNAFNWDGGPLTMRGCSIECPGQKVFFSPDPNITGHVEAINISGGRIIIDRCLFDCEGGDVRANAWFGKSGGGASALLFWQARNERVVATVSNSLILPRKLFMYYTMQMGDDRQGDELTMTNNVIQKATAPNGPANASGHYADGGVRVFKGSGNLDFATGKPIPGRINSGA